MKRTLRLGVLLDIAGSVWGRERDRSCALEARNLDRAAMDGERNGKGLKRKKKDEREREREKVGPCTLYATR